jgi:hypothetical protein
MFISGITAAIYRFRHSSRHNNGRMQWGRTWKKKNRKTTMRWLKEGIWIISSYQELPQPHKDLDIIADIITKECNGEDMEEKESENYNEMVERY